MSYEPDLQIKKLCALENSRSKTLVLQAREGLPVDEGGVMMYVYAALEMIVGGVLGLVAAMALALALFGTIHIVAAFVNAFVGVTTDLDSMDLWVPSVAWAVWWYLGVL